MVKQISKYQPLVRDVNITVHKRVSYGEVVKRFTGVEYLESFTLIDLFRKDHEKIFTVRLKFVCYDKQLTGNYIDKVVKMINDN